MGAGGVVRLWEGSDLHTMLAPVLDLMLSTEEREELDEHCVVHLTLTDEEILSITNNHPFMVKTREAGSPRVQEYGTLWTTWDDEKGKDGWPVVKRGEKPIERVGKP